MLRLPTFAIDSDVNAIRTAGFQNIIIPQSSFVGVLQHIVQNKDERSVIFQGPIEFNSSWPDLHQAYFEATPPETDVIYMGYDTYINNTSYNIIKKPTFSTHALLITLNGAQKLLDICSDNSDSGSCSSDYELKINHEMSKPDSRIDWVVWNISMFGDGIRSLVHKVPAVATTAAKLLVVVVSCHKNKHRWHDILNKGIPNLILIVGNAGQDINTPSEILSIQTDRVHKTDDNILHLGCNDVYDGLPVKITKMIDYVLKTPEYDDITHVIKIDDDNGFSKETIDSIEQMLRDGNIYDFMGQKRNVGQGMRNYHWMTVGLHSHWRNKLYSGEMVPWLHGGSSYILTRRAMRVINNEYTLENIDTVYQKEIFEDVMVARILGAHGIYPKEINYGIVGDRP